MSSSNNISVLPLLSPELTKLYEPLAVVGYGAFAMVVKAIERESGRLVAIKHFQTAGGQRKKYFQELKFIMRLNHPHIVRCLDVSSADEDTSDLVLEFAEGGSLRERLFENVPLDVADAMTIVNQAARGLVHAHGQGIVHRDMKPENILMFRRDGMGPTGTEKLGDWLFKISDFGIAKYIGLQNKTMTSIGSPAYMAPEQFYDEYDLKTDIYALGAILFELLHGRVPFDGSPAVIFKGHLEQMPAVRPDLPESVTALLMRMMDKKAVARPSAEQLSLELEAWTAGKPRPLSMADIGARPLSLADIGASPLEPAADSVKTAVERDVRDSDTIDLSPESSEALRMQTAAQSSGRGPVESPGAAEAPKEQAKPTPAPKEDVKPAPAPAVLVASAKVPARGGPPAPRVSATSSSENPRYTPPMTKLRDVLPDSKDSFPEAEVILMPGDTDFGMTPKQRIEARQKREEEERAKAARRGDHSMFEDAFGKSRGEGPRVPVNLSELNRRVARRVGKLSVTKSWSRAIDSRCGRLFNLGGGDQPLITATDDALWQLKANGGRGDQIHSGKIDFLGSPGVGTLAFLAGGNMRVVHEGRVTPQTWSLATRVGQLLFSPSRESLVMMIDGEVSYHDGAGESLWSGRMSEGDHELFLAFDTSERLMVAALGSPDCSVRFYSRDGEELASHLMPGPITGAARSMNGIGAWLVVDTDEGPMLTWVSADGVATAVLVDRPLQGLVGGADWVCGRDAEGRLWIVDPTSSTLSPAEVSGTVLDYELGFSPRQLFVLEQRGDVMRYVSAFEISMKAEAKR